MLSSNLSPTLILVLCASFVLISNVARASTVGQPGSKTRQKHGRRLPSENFARPHAYKEVEEEVKPAPRKGVSLTHSTHTMTRTVRRRSMAATLSSLGIEQQSLQRNGVFIGFLPDAGVEGGTLQTMDQLNSAVGKDSAAYGWYAQVQSGIPFEGMQLLWKMEDIKGCNCVFQPALMPLGGWQGLTKKDNSQAIAIAQVMKQFTDEGVPVWLRFAHEANWYQTDGTYDGDVNDFQEGWAVVAAACKKIAPKVKMWWSPNVDKADNYAKYAPKDMSTVQVVGVDYYPKKIVTGHEFRTKMQAFHDTYATNGRVFALGETGLGWAGSRADRLGWLNQIISAKEVMPNLVLAAWFNYRKEYDYQLIYVKDTSLNNPVKDYLDIN